MTLSHGDSDAAQLPFRRSNHNPGSPTTYIISSTIPSSNRSFLTTSIRWAVEVPLGEKRGISSVGREGAVLLLLVEGSAYCRYLHQEWEGLLEQNSWRPDDADRNRWGRASTQINFRKE